MTKLDAARIAHAFELDGDHFIHDDDPVDATVDGGTLAWLVIL